MDILGKIRRLQEERGWSENHLAEQAHLSQSTINSLYRKGNVPTHPDARSDLPGLWDDDLPVPRGGQPAARPHRGAA
ncbi:MAG: hypothetical protein ACLVL7_07440 [Anaerotruncus massiliensis (ex Togo et al. 2019)]